MCRRRRGLDERSAFAPLVSRGCRGDNCGAAISEVHGGLRVSKRFISRNTLVAKHGERCVSELACRHNDVYAEATFRQGSEYRSVSAPAIWCKSASCVDPLVPLPGNEYVCDGWSLRVPCSRVTSSSGFARSRILTPGSSVAGQRVVPA